MFSAVCPGVCEFSNREITQIHRLPAWSTSSGPFNAFHVLRDSPSFSGCPASDVVPQSTRDGVWYISPQGDDQGCLSFKAIQGSLTTLVDQVLSWRLIFCFQRPQGTERPESHIPWLMTGNRELFENSILLNCFQHLWLFKGVSWSYRAQFVNPEQNEFNNLNSSWFFSSAVNLGYKMQCFPIMSVHKYFIDAIIFDVK